MSTEMILEEVKRLPRAERIKLAEDILSVLKTANGYDFTQEAEGMRDAYLHDKELTIFSGADGDEFYEYKTGDLVG